ncbi:sensor histidine kinase [Anatilimnocola floriformis]|uniref:sensor histidine kinase n=1 Tax=Anatilimnocola floriformis TaxID=2948575 RepID=UPI0020C4C223|nr:HAMP domain-containing sensor histidine kinase [Anatilimnocola floriformis]
MPPIDADIQSRFAQDLEREKLASLKQFAYGLSHEINNPLTNISMRAQSLLASEKDADRRRALEAINAQAFRAFEMLADLMLFAHPPQPNVTAFDAAELLREVVAQQAATAKEQQTKLHLAEVPADLPLLSADRTQIAAALAALIKNALEALRTSGEIQLVAAASGEHFEFTVSDNGPGISPEVRRHLFDPFFSGREAGRGLGLGLCKAWRIAELHQGEITVESERGSGARFTLRVKSLK